MTTRIRIGAALALLAALAAPLAAQPAPEPAPPLALDDYEIHQYVSTGGLMPLDVMRLDTNGEILIACQQPRTREELAELGVEALESQLVLLRVMRMLRLREGRLETLVPLLDGAETARLREATAALVPGIVAAVRDEVVAMEETLGSAGHGGHAHSVLFSYVLDGLAWDFFEEYGEVAPRRLSSASPHWAGEIWGTHPRRENAPGTSSVMSGDLVMKVSAIRGSGGPVDWLLSEWRDLRDLLRREIDPDNFALRPEIKARLASFGMIDGEGALAVPVVVQRSGEKLFELAQTVTEEVTRAVREDLDLETLGRDLELRDRQQTLIVAYHELMGQLMSAFEAEGLVTRPEVLSDPAGADAEAVARIAFVVDRRAERPARSDQEAADQEAATDGP